MSVFRQLVTGGGDDYERRKKAVEALSGDFPIVAEVLAGSPGDGKTPPISEGSITFFLDADKAKFKIFVKSEGASYFGVVADMLNPWGSINSALLVNDVSRKRDSGQNDATKKVPY